jgi:hypothetical protein
VLRSQFPIERITMKWKWNRTNLTLGVLSSLLCCSVARDIVKSWGSASDQAALFRPS